MTRTRIVSRAIGGLAIRGKAVSSSINLFAMHSSAARATRWYDVPDRKDGSVTAKPAIAGVTPRQVRLPSSQQRQGGIDVTPNH